MKDETTVSITAYYEKDHDRLDQLFQKFQASKRSDFPKAKDLFREFKTGLQRHIVWEEEILFPSFEAKTGMKGTGPTEVMRQEHREIKALLEGIHHKVQEGDPESDPEEAALLDVLGAHNRKEERVLYPTIDELLSEQEHREVFKKMEDIPESAYRSCCEVPHP